MKAIIRSSETTSSPDKRDMSDISTNADYRHKFYSIGKNKAKVELYSQDGTYNGRVTIPSERYPLIDKTSFRVFNTDNCKEVTDALVIDCIDRVRYKAGHCYSMADELSKEFSKHKVAHNLWHGWLFTDVNKEPIHHCWVTVGKNDESVIDLQDDTAFLHNVYNNINKNDKVTFYDLTKQLAVERMKGNVLNSKCCYPIGIPIQYYYVGCKIKNVIDAKRIYNNLIEKYPNHPCENNVVYENGMTKMQYEIYKEIGANYGKDND